MPKTNKLKHGWKDIESAPKDGRYVIVSAGDLHAPTGTAIVVARFQDGHWKPMFSNGQYCGPLYWQKLPKVIKSEPVTCSTTVWPD